MSTDSLKAYVWLRALIKTVLSHFFGISKSLYIQLSNQIVKYHIM